MSAKEIWTKEDLKNEFDFRVEERLAIMCGFDQETAEQLAVAFAEADAACEILKGQQ